MTKAQAEIILQRPRFGDPDCIRAVERLADEPRVQRLRTLLVGKYIQCGACGGAGDRCKILSPTQALEIRASDAPPSQLAEAYGVSRSAIRKVISGETWKGIGGNV